MNNNKESNVLGGALAFLLLPIITVLFLLNTAYPAMMTWNMFVPAKFGLPSLSIAEALMVVFVIAMFRGSKVQRVEDNRTKETKTNDVVLMLIAPWLVYLMAFITYKMFIV